MTVRAIAKETEPRLWIRRLAIWEDERGPPLRDVSLRPGLNVVWSPDGPDALDRVDAEAIGHGAGKTLFCRLLRYCLGEPRFADEDQRALISTAFPNGFVGAEIVVGGTVWAVLRPLGARRRVVAVPGGNLDAIAAGEGLGTGIEPFVEAVETAVLGNDVARLARLPGDLRAWPIALAMLARDQECRFDDVLYWRSPLSGSDSPVPASGQEVTPRLEALRAFIGAITIEEQEERSAAKATSDVVAGHEREITALDSLIRRTYAKIAREHSVPFEHAPDLPAVLVSLKSIVDDRIAGASELPLVDAPGLSKAAEAFDQVSRRSQVLAVEKAGLDAELPVQERLLRTIEADVPNYFSEADDVRAPPCPVCEVPINRVKAEGCGLSDKLPDFDRLKARADAKLKEASEVKAAIAAIRSRLKALDYEIAAADQALERERHRVARYEAVKEARTTAWTSATRMEADVEALRILVEERDEANAQRREVSTRLEKQRGRVAHLRERQATVFGRFNEKFSPIVSRLIGPTARGAATLSGNGLDVKIDVSGDRRTAAITSLKVIAFDLACMCLGIEQATNIPPFLIHDSPREADLGRSIYDKVFRLAIEIEQMTPKPLFQYIITTTTRPPDQVRVEPWLRLTLQGSPGSERLLRRDL